MKDYNPRQPYALLEPTIQTCGHGFGLRSEHLRMMQNYMYVYVALAPKPQKLVSEHTYVMRLFEVSSSGGQLRCAMVVEYT